MSSAARLALAMIALLVAAPAVSQDPTAAELIGEDEFQQQPYHRRVEPASVQPGQIAETGSGRVGQRQTREEAAPNVRPMRRISNRINNRVQARIRNRIEPGYDPQANAASPFEVAEDAGRTAAARGR